MDHIQITASTVVEAIEIERRRCAAEIEKLRALILLGDFSSLRPNSDSFKLVQQIRREQSNVKRSAGK